jgi:hypothetical protein
MHPKVVPQSILLLKFPREKTNLTPGTSCGGIVSAYAAGRRSRWNGLYAKLDRSI